jgi:hypothetical protein
VYPAGQGPSIADTVRFISNFASVYDTSLERDRPELSPMNPCVITFINGSGGWIIDFRSLNPDSLRLQEDPALIEVSTTNGERTIKFKKFRVAPAWFHKGRGFSHGRDLAVGAAAREFDPREVMLLDSITFNANLGAEEKLPKVREALVSPIILISPP